MQFPNPVSVIPPVICPHMSPTVQVFNADLRLSVAGGRRATVIAARYYVPCVFEACPAFRKDPRDPSENGPGWCEKGKHSLPPKPAPAPDPGDGEEKAA